MTTFLNTFRKVGGAFDVRDDGIRFYHPGGDLRSIVVETNVHPGFMTDWQQPLVVALTQAQGLSIVHETVYENRFGFTGALRKMGATIQVYRECLGGTECRFGQRNFYHSAVISGHCTAPTSSCPICAAASPTSLRRWPPRASAGSRASISSIAVMSTS